MKALISLILLLIVSALGGSAMYLTYLKSKDRQAAALEKADAAKEKSHAQIEETLARVLADNGPFAADHGRARDELAASFLKRLGRRSREILSGDPGSKHP